MGDSSSGVVVAVGFACICVIMFSAVASSGASVGVNVVLLASFSGGGVRGGTGGGAGSFT